jgi:hypothetical protein
MTKNQLAQVEAIGKRFAGVDIQFRRNVPKEWAGAWRITIVASKNERAKYRTVIYGATFEEAARKTIGCQDTFDAYSDKP